jgi:hypothetical protein
MTATTPSCSFSQCLVSQRPAFDKRGRRKPWANTVKGKSGVYRPDKRQKPKFL